MGESGRYVNMWLCSLKENYQTAKSPKTGGGLKTAGTVAIT